jgi:valyl-tRNA synthetase
MTNEEIPKAYDPKACEGKLYKFWEERGYFGADPNADRPKYCITIPPPNITGELHLGHALQHAIHDALVRWKRMSGYETLCLPGMDHASIATHKQVEAELRKEGLSRFDLGREKFLERAWAWKEEYGGKILDQLKALGCSYDWPRLRFTLDDHYADAVLEVFVRMYNKGWIYRGLRVTNWCPGCHTAISDLEVEHKEVAGHLWHIAYPARDGSFELVVATTRPETMLGDTAVSVHPSDSRYKAYVGKTVILPLMERELPVIADAYVDMEFGTGCLKITPAHDPNDFEIGETHNLPQVTVIGTDARMTEEAGEFAGLDRFEARDRVVAALEGKGLIREIEDYSHSVGHCARCGTMIEPLLSLQWFVAMKDLAKLALDAIPGGKNQEIVEYIPDRYARLTQEWLENIRDWCISRQLWWGHRIPMWYCEACEEPVASKTRPEECPKCGKGDFKQDEDILDTWFSSALWPFVVLGWPDDTPELKAFYPTDIMITARDILYLWVARMIMTSLEYDGRIPFREVFVHATILDKHGRRMSRTLGTGVDPVDLKENYGADATRLGLLLMAAKGQDIRFGVERIEQARNFANKLWNATRFILLTVPGGPAQAQELKTARSLPLRWIRSRLAATIEQVSEAIADYRFDDAANSIYTFVWSEFCDWYLETAKTHLDAGGEGAQEAASGIVSILEETLRLLHPFMPYITEELWQLITQGDGSIMVADYPKADPGWRDADAESEMAALQEIVRSIRNVRAEIEFPASERIETTVAAPRDMLSSLESNQGWIEFLGRAQLTALDSNSEEATALLTKRHVTAVAGPCRLVFPQADVAREIERLEKALGKAQAEVARAEKKLGNAKFIENAPPDLVEEERTKLSDWQAREAEIRERLASLR